MSSRRVFSSFHATKFALTLLLVLALCLFARPAAAQTGLEDLSVVVNGAGGGNITNAEDGLTSPVTFLIIAGYRENGEGDPDGYINFTLGGSFARFWGVDEIFLSGKITAISQENGKIVLEGNLTEADRIRNEVVLLVAGDEFTIEIPTNSGPRASFWLEWCDVDPLTLGGQVKVTNGRLTVNPENVL